jgi:predicted O-linked N-acetylglucosamine transferase (SPINDLY family)
MVIAVFIKDKLCAKKIGFYRIEMGNNRKKHCDIRRNNKNQQKVLQFDDWKKEMPQWLKDAYTVVEDGQIEEATQLLKEEVVQNAMKNMSGHIRVFAMYAIAALLTQIGQAERAEGLYDEILKTNTHSAIYNDLANIYKDSGRLSKAMRYYQKAIEENPNEPMLWSNFSLCLMRLGYADKSIALMRKTAEKLPDNDFVHSSLLLHLHYLSEVNHSSIFEESRKWAQRNLPQSLAKTFHRNDPDPQRKLRIGYVSPDFCLHSVAYFFEPLLDSHNRDIVEVYGYGNVNRCDSTTERLKGKFDHYRNIRPLDDKAIAKLIEKDNIDILVDLAGHSAGSKIYVMAYKPAPVQVTWLGYPDTTGMSQIDYRLTDEIADPAGSEKFYSEELFYLPEGFLCYGPGSMMPPVVQSPCLERKNITFGSFNNSTKINPVVIETWSRILKSTPGSSLLLKFKSGSDNEICQIYLDRFASHGISPDRIRTSDWLPASQHLELYGQVDIALDTFPYNGTTTTCQALLMGVPVISLLGEHHISRVGHSILSRLGLEFFVASTLDEYVAKAVALASNAEALDKIRSSMRMRMAVSPLCNKVKFAKNIENAYRQMWHRWCKDNRHKKYPGKEAEKTSHERTQFCCDTI